MKRRLATIALLVLTIVCYLRQGLTALNVALAMATMIPAVITTMIVIDDLIDRKQRRQPTQDND